MSGRAALAGHRFLTGGAVLLWPLLTIAAGAAPPGSPGCAADHHDGPPAYQDGPPADRDAPPAHRGRPPEPPGLPGGPMDEMRPPPFLRGVVLTDEQEDRVFTLLHGAAPALRQQSKAARAARRSLHELVTSAQFSDLAAGALAQAQGEADAQTALLRARLERDLYRVLTPEQIARLTAHEQEWQSHRGEGSPRP